MARNLVLGQFVLVFLAVQFEMSTVVRQSSYNQTFLIRQHCCLIICIGWGDKCCNRSQDPNNSSDSETRCLVYQVGPKIFSGFCPYLAYLGAYLSVLNMVKWGVPEKILQNAVQMRWCLVNMTLPSKVMTKSHFWPDRPIVIKVVAGADLWVFNAETILCHS